MQVNDLIFKELIKRGYALVGNTRVWNIADSKLWYLTPEQAQSYLDVEDSKTYQGSIADIEFNLIEKYINKIIERVLQDSPVNIIDIGCGDGRKAVPIIEKIAKIVKIRYCPIDISSYMVGKAIERMRKLNHGEVVQFQWNISDFDNLENVAPLIRNEDFRQNFFLFLGGTASNFEIHEVMYEIAEALDKGLDYLLIGVGLRTKNVESLAKQLQSLEFDRFFGKVLEQIGFSRTEIEFGTRYRHPRIEWVYTIKKDKTITLGERKLSFSAGDQILVGMSYRYTKEEFNKAMKIYFKEVKFFISNDGSRALILCHK
jgi:uncharacterized SAM-dependent methyltransferase